MNKPHICTPFNHFVLPVARLVGGAHHPIRLVQTNTNTKPHSFPQKLFLHLSSEIKRQRAFD